MTILVVHGVAVKVRPPDTPCATPATASMQGSQHCLPSTRSSKYAMTAQSCMSRVLGLKRKQHPQTLLHLGLTCRVASIPQHSLPLSPHCTIAMQQNTRIRQIRTRLRCLSNLVRCIQESPPPILRREPHPYPYFALTLPQYVYQVVRTRVEAIKFDGDDLLSPEFDVNCAPRWRRGRGVAHVVFAVSRSRGSWIPRRFDGKRHAVCRP